MNDLQSLVGNGNNPQDKWQTNFVIDEYCKLIQSASEGKTVRVKTLSWEIFEKGQTVLVDTYKKMNHPSYKCTGSDPATLQCNTFKVLVSCRKWSLH